MASGQFAVVYRQIGRLFTSGSVAGLSEGQLLDRFVAHRDDSAFEAIVARHGPMVLGVCRANLHDPNDVDDAFQATFLVLVKKAETLRQRDLLGNWLYGVALRVARRARIEAAKRRDRRPTGPEPVAREADEFDVRPLLHDEVNRLPESYRAAVVLCFLEGRTHEEAARELGWPVGTVKGRLARAKEILRGRLTRRGLAVPSGAVAGWLAKEGRAAVAPALLESTTSAALAVASTPLAALSAMAVSPHVIALTQGALHAMSTTKLKLAATLIVAGLLSAPGVSAYQDAKPAAKPDGSAVPKADVGKASGAADVAKASRTVPDASPLEARLKIAEEVYSQIVRMQKNGMVVDNQMAHLWFTRLQQVKLEVAQARKKAEGPAYEFNQAVREVAMTRAEEARAVDRANSGGIAPFEDSDAKFRRIEAEERLAHLSKNRPGGTAVPEPEKSEGGFGGAGESRPRPKPLKEHPADLDRNKRIEAALEKVVPMNFPNDAPLEVVLQYVKENTKGADGRPIPIYLDPAGLEEAEKTKASPVSIEIDGLPLRTTLRLILKQLGLEYRVRSGLLFISGSATFEEEENPQLIPSGPGGLQ